MKQPRINRELDADIAEKIFGMEVNRAVVTQPLLPFHGRVSENEEWWKIPLYSSSVEDARRVVSKISELGGVIEGKFFQLYDGYNLKLIKPGEKVEMVREDPTEICEVAIAAYDYAEKYNQ